MALKDLPLLDKDWEFPAKVKEVARIQTKSGNPEQHYVVGRSNFSVFYAGQGRGSPSLIIDGRATWDKGQGCFISNERTYRLIHMDAIKSYDTVETF
ncbi:hypothetical protein HN747_01315 [archaeon]|jgi:hypothetical protein|nr:hypothetical protein [archaeon]